MLYHNNSSFSSQNFCRYFVQFYTSSRPSQVSLLNCIQLYNFFIKLCTIQYFLLNCVQLYNISYQIVYNLYSDLYKKYSIFKVRFFVLFLFCLSFHFFDLLKYLIYVVFSMDKSSHDFLILRKNDYFCNILVI